jgi:hypothetical protein
VWPENWLALQVFIRMGTQWNVSMAGPIGLRYEALPLVMRTVCVPQADQADVHEAVMDMEQETLRLAREARR